MNKRAYNLKLTKAKGLIFEAEVLLDEVRHNEDVPQEIKDGLTFILQRNTKDAMDNISDLLHDGVKKRRKK